MDEKLPATARDGVSRDRTSSLITVSVVVDGDTIHRAAAALRTALVGRPLTCFESPVLEGPRPAIGRIVERVESHGKHLEIMWDDGLVLHTHMRMSGSWHLYRAGEQWRKPMHQMRVAIVVPEWSAVCFNAPVVETYREFDRHRHPGFGRLGPDLCKPDADLDECVQRMVDYHDGSTPVGEVLLDQRVACGVGNVFRSEVLWACELHPFTAVDALTDLDRAQVVRAAARMLRSNLESFHRVTAPAVPGGLAVYGRNGQRCPRCGDTIEVRRMGEHSRLVYWCPGCQQRRDAEPAASPDGPSTVMDPHPAAAKYLADLPWRRHDPLAG